VQYCPVLVVIVQTIFESLLSMFEIDLINLLEIQNIVLGVADILFHQIYFDSPNLLEYKINKLYMFQQVKASK
jgi:hypothetical protein